MEKAKSKHSTILVIAVCNFDDVLCGAFPPTADGIKQAQLKAKRIAKDPDLRFKNVNQAADTEFIFARVLRLNGEDTPIEMACFDPGSKAKKAKRKACK